MTSAPDPYAGNLLTDFLRPILSQNQASAALTHLPAAPEGMSMIPPHIRLHYLMRLRELHIPSYEEIKLLQTIDLVLRDSYRHRDPSSVSTWAALRGSGFGDRPRPPAMASLVAGLSGTGKTSALRHIFGTYKQCIDHTSFPMIAGPFRQVVWLSCDVPASGRSVDLACSLMRAWDAITPTERFSRSLTSRKKGSLMLDEWRQVASTHFLGVLHLDEVQNFFRSQAIARRRSAKKMSEKLDLTIVEDECLKWFLNMVNTSQIAVIFSGTPDGVSALTTRLATTQRITTGGYHLFKHFEQPDDQFYSTLLMPTLMNYQFVAHPLRLTAELTDLILALSGGLIRIIIALWVAAHRIAFERSTGDLRISDFQRAADTYLAPLKPAVAAIRSRDPQRMHRYEDLIQNDQQFWASFWSAS